MKKFIKTFILAVCLFLPAMFCLTACGERKVVSISVELASNSTYTLIDGKITIEYGEKVAMSGDDFVVTATLEDDETKTIAVKSDSNKNGFTFSSTIPNDEITPVGEYTLTFGHKNLAETDFITINVDVVKKTINLNTLGLTWKDEKTPIVYDGEYHTNEITNLPKYLEIESHNDNREKYPNGAIYPDTNITVGINYAIVSIKVKDEYADRYVIEGNKSILHPWIIQKAEMSVPDIDWANALENYTYNGTPITTKITDNIKAQLDSLNISASLSDSATQTNAEEYQVTISFTYTGEDKTCYNLGDDYLIGTRIATWKINPQEIDVSGVELKIKGGDTYSKAFTYDGQEKSVVFNLNSLKDKGYTNDSTYPLEQGLPSGLPSTGSEILELFEQSGTFSATNAGEYPVSISFRITSIYQQNYKFKDTENNEVTINKTWKIDKQIIDTSNVILKRSGGYDYTDTILRYNGKEQTVVFDVSSLQNYLTGESDTKILSYTTSGTTGTNADTYTATITFTLSDTVNYTLSNVTVSKQWKINKGELGVIAAQDQHFVFGTTQEYISTHAQLAPASLGYDGGYSIEFAETENAEIVTAIYNRIKEAITFEVRVDDYAKTAYTGTLNAGSYYLYPVIPNGLTFDNYEVTSGGCVRFTVTKANLTLTVNDKTNQSDDYDSEDMLALTYDGKAKAYTINDVISTGLVNGNTLESLGLTFEYAKREFEVIDSVLSFTDSDDITWTTDAPINAGAYQVRAVINTGNYNVTSNAGKMLIMRKGVKITFADLTFNYGVKVSELNPTYTLGGDVHYHIGGNFYQYISNYYWEDYIGYKAYNTTNQEVESILSELQITLEGKYSFGNYVGNEETFIDTFVPWDLSDEDVVGTGTYKITFNQELLDELNSKTNYEFVIVEGRLTIE